MINRFETNNTRFSVVMTYNTKLYSLSLFWWYVDHFLTWGLGQIFWKIRLPFWLIYVLCLYCIVYMSYMKVIFRWVIYALYNESESLWVYPNIHMFYGKPLKVGTPRKWTHPEAILSPDSGLSTLRFWKSEQHRAAWENLRFSHETRM